MKYSQSERYLLAKQFIEYCKELNVKTDEHELEHYEKIGVLLPLIRIVYPPDYAKKYNAWRSNFNTEQPDIRQWPDLSRLFDEHHLLDEEYADITDDELIDSFDREMEKSPYLIKPTPNSYTPWNSYEYADNYYSCWQVHQLYEVQRHPDLYVNLRLIKHIPDEIKERFYIPSAPKPEYLREFNSMAVWFDALSFWITHFTRLQKRAFARVPIKHKMQHLEKSQYQVYLTQLKIGADLTKNRFGLNVEDSYKFLSQLLQLRDAYRNTEHYKLANELEENIFHQSRFIGNLTNQEWDGIVKEIERRFGIWKKRDFQHLNVFYKERDEARDLLNHLAKTYKNDLKMSGIASSSLIFSSNEIDELSDYCTNDGFPVLFTALSGMIYTDDDYAQKNRRVAKYTNIKNATTSLEILLRKFADKGDVTINGTGLSAAVQSIFKNETSWISLFNSNFGKGFANATRGLSPAIALNEYYSKLTYILSNKKLTQTEGGFWARVFLVTCLTRNLTAHSYPEQDWFFGELIGEMEKAVIYAILYSWKVAKKEGWV